MKGRPPCLKKVVSQEGRFSVELTECLFDSKNNFDIHCTSILSLSPSIGPSPIPVHYYPQYIKLPKAVVMDGKSFRTSSSGNTMRNVLSQEGKKDSNILHDPDDIKVPPIFLKIAEQISQGVFGLLFALQRKSRGVKSPLWVFLFETSELLQLLSFPFRKEADFAWNPSHTDWFMTLVNGSVPESLVQGNQTVFYIVLILLGMVLLNAALIGYYFSQNQYRFVWTLRYLRTVCTLFMTILYIPVISLFTSMLTQCTDNNGLPVSCWAGVMIVQTVVVIVVSVIFIALSLTFALSVFQQDPTDRSEILSRPHARADVYYLVVKTVLSIVFTTLEGQPGSQWILVIFCLLASSSTFMAFAWFIPFYRWFFSVLRTTYLAIFLWASICLTVVEVLQEPDTNSVTIMFFLICPATVFVSNYVMNQRKEYIRKAPITHSINPCTVELKARFILEDNGCLFNVKALNNENGLDTVKVQNRTEALKAVTDLYQQTANIKTNSSLLYMFWANFCLYHGANKQRSLVLLAECMKRNPMIDERFVVFRQRKIMNEESSSENVDMLEFIICESHMKKATKHKSRAVSLQLTFWSELLKEAPNLQKLFVMGSSINSEVTIADFHFSKAIMSGAKSSRIFKSYAKFLADVCNDTNRSEEMNERAKHMEELRRRTVQHDGIIDMNNIIVNGGNDKDMAILTIDHKGIILSANEGVKAVLGYKKPQDLLGENIDILVPPPLNRVHGQILSKYMNVGEGHIINKLRKIFGRRADGYIIPVMISVRQLTFGITATFIGVLKTVPEGTQAHDYIMLDQDGFVKAMTERCSSYFGNTLAEVERYQLHITDWIENFDEVSHLMSEKEGHKLELDLDGALVELTCCLGATTAGPCSLIILRLTNNSDKSGVSSINEDMNNVRNEMPMVFNTDIAALKKDKKIAKKVTKSGTHEEIKKKPVREHKESFNKKAKQDAISNKVVAGSAVDTGSLFSETEESVHSESGSQKQGLSKSSTAEDDHQSVSKSMTSQASSSINRMMRVSFSKRIDLTISRLRIMRQAIFTIFAVSILFAIALNVSYSILYGQHLQYFDDMRTCGNNRASMPIILESVRRLVQSQFNGVSSSDLISMKDAILAQTDSLNSQHFDLYSRASSYLPSDYTIFTTQDLILYGGSIEQNVSLNDAMVAFTSQASVLAIQVASGASDSFSTALGRLASIQIDTISSRMNDLCFAYYRAYEAGTVNMPLSISLFSLIPFGALYVICGALVFVILAKTNSEAKVVYSLFMNVPKDVINSMYKHTYNTLKSISADVDNSNVFSTGTSADRKNQAVISEVFEFSNLLGIAARIATSSEQIKDESHVYEFANLKKIGLRLVLFVIVTAAYALGFSLYASQYYVTTAGFAAPVFWSNTVQYSAGETLFRLETLYWDNATFYANDTGFSTRLNDVTKLVDEFANQTLTILYGDPRLGSIRYLEAIRVSMAGFPDGEDSMNMLLSSPDNYISPVANCAEVNMGALKNGQFNALYPIISLSRDVIGTVRNVQFLDPHTTAELFGSYKPLQDLSVMVFDCLQGFQDHFEEKYAMPTATLANTITYYAQTTCTVFLAISLLVLFYVVIKPILLAIEQEVALTPSMLMMLPTNVLMKVDAIKQFTQAVGN